MSGSIFGADPHEWLRRQEDKVAELTEQANQMHEQLAGAGATATSSDRSVTVTVNANGQLHDLQLSTRVDKYTPVRITQTIMETYREACTQATRSTMEIMSGFIGDDSEAMDLFRQQLPTDPDDDSEGRR